MLCGGGIKHHCVVNVTLNCNVMLCGGGVTHHCVVNVTLKCNVTLCGGGVTHHWVVNVTLNCNVTLCGGGVTHHCVVNVTLNCNVSATSHIECVKFWHMLEWCKWHMELLNGEELCDSEGGWETHGWFQQENSNKQDTNWMMTCE